MNVAVSTAFRFQNSGLIKRGLDTFWPLLTVLAIIDVIYAHSGHYWPFWPLLSLFLSESSSIQACFPKRGNDRLQRKAARKQLNTELGLRTRAGGPEHVQKLPDRGAEFGISLPAWNGSFVRTRFRAIPCFRVFPLFIVSERQNSLCFQIGKIPFVISTIKSRLLLVN